MRRFFAWIGNLVGRRRRGLLGLSILAVLLAAAGPFLWTAYHAFAAERALNRYHSGEARRHFHVCLSVWPWSGSAHLHLLAARAARRQGQFEEAAQLLRVCQDTLHDNSPQAVLEWAMLRAAMGDLDTTAEPLRQAARQDPQLAPLVLEALTEGYLAMSRITDALHSSDDWLALEPNNVQAWFLRGKIHRRTGAVQAIVADYQRVLELDPQRTEARWWLALALFDIGRFQEAYQQWEIFQQSHPHNVEVRIRRAMCLWQLGNEDEARRLVDGVLAEHPHQGLALLARGQMFMRAGRHAEAEPWLRQAAGILPHDYAAQNALWECLRQLGKTEEAETQRERKELLWQRLTRRSDILTRLISQKPDDPALSCELGTLNFQLGDPQVGEAWLLNALRLDEHYLPALEALAEHYRESGDSELAEQYRRRAQSAKSQEPREEKKN